MNQVEKQYLKERLREEILANGTPTADSVSNTNWIVAGLLFLTLVLFAGYTAKSSQLRDYLTIGKGVDLQAQIHRTTQRIIYGANAPSGAASCPGGVYDNVRQACYGSMLDYEYIIRSETRI